MASGYGWQYLCDLSRDGLQVPNFTLLDHAYKPTQLSALRHGVLDLLGVGAELLPPELRPRLGRRGQVASGVPVPQAAMPESHKLVPAQDDVRAPRKVAAAESEPDTRAVEHRGH
jgi:hypothetical protein